MKKSVLILLAFIILCGCNDKKEQQVKAPTRVETLLVSPALVDNAQTYVGIVEEREATAVSFTSMGTWLTVFLKNV